MFKVHQFVYNFENYLTWKLDIYIYRGDKKHIVKSIGKDYEQFLT